MSYHDLAGLVTFRPLSTPLPEPTHEGVSPFSAPLRRTVQTLVKEVRHLHPQQALLEADFTENQLRQDGMPRATARAASPGLVLTLVGTAHGDLRYPCHTYHYWEDNLRAHGGVRPALQATHPDHGGDAEDFADVQAAREAGA